MNAFMFVPTTVTDIAAVDAIFVLIMPETLKRSADKTCVKVSTDCGVDAITAICTVRVSVRFESKLLVETHMVASALLPAI